VTATTAPLLDHDHFQQQNEEKSFYPAAINKSVKFITCAYRNIYGLKKKRLSVNV